jgi:hypothetical protein
MFRMLPEGAILPFSPISLDSNDNQTVACGFQKRLLREVPQPQPELLLQLKQFTQRYLEANLSRVHVPDFETWLASTAYNEARKNELRTVKEELHGGFPTKRQCSHIDTFVKTESYTELKHCRMINSRSDYFKVISGPVFKAIEDEVYRLHPFIKHVPVPERPALIAALLKHGRRYYQTDYTAFESHFVRPIMEALELQLYDYCLADYPELARLIRRTISGTNCMRTRSGCHATVEARRMSGDTCTSLGNGFSNLMLTLFLIDQKGGMYDGFVEGDDGLFSTDVPLSAEDFKALGFTIKIEEITDPRFGSFCGMVFAEGNQIIKSPLKFLSTFGWTSSFIDAGDKVMKQLLRAKALSACYEAPHCPILGIMARRALIITEGVVPRFVNDGYHVPHDSASIPQFNPLPSTRVLFAQLFGVSVEAQLSAEQAILVGDYASAGLILSSIVPEDMLFYASNYVSQ